MSRDYSQPMPANDKKGFWPSLFVLSNDNLVSPTLIKTIYVLAQVMESLFTAYIFIVAYTLSVCTTDEFGNTSGAHPVLFLFIVVFAALFWVFMLLATRV